MTDNEEVNKVVGEPAAESITGGLIGASLGRTNAEIRRDRGNAIAEDLEMSFRRGVEDLRIKLKRLTRDRDAMFDFSPTNALSLVLIKDLDTSAIREKDAKLTIEIRQVRIEIEEAEARYQELFGKVA